VHDVIVTEGGIVHGTVHARGVVLGGIVRGDIHAVEVTILPNGHCHGSIVAMRTNREEA